MAVLSGGCDSVPLGRGAAVLPERIWQFGAAGALTTATAIRCEGATVYVAGNTSGDLHGVPRTGLSDLFVSSYEEETGSRRWTSLLGASGRATFGSSLFVGANGAIHASGSTNGGLEGPTPTGSQDAVVAAFEGLGVLQWVKQRGVAGTNTALRDSTFHEVSGSFYTVGTTAGGLGGETLTGTNDAFVTRHDSTGSPVWTRLLGDAGRFSDATSVAVTPAGDVYVAGLTYGALGGPLQGTTDAFLAKYNPNGVLQWVQQAGAAGASTQFSALTVTPAGLICGVGATSGSLFGLPLQGNAVGMLACYDDTGARQFAKRLGAPSSVTGFKGVSVDAAGTLYVTGSTTGSVAGAALSGTKDALLVKVSISNDDWVWVRQLGASGVATEALAVSASSSRVWISGSTRGKLGSAPQVGTQDGFIAAYDSEGNLR